MNKLTVFAALVAASLSSAGLAQEAHQDPYGDATVSRADAQAKAVADFDRLDTNRDGKLSADELNASSGPGGGRMGAMLLRFADANGDGAIGKDEFIAAAMKRFDSADADGNGQLTKAERDAAREARRQRWQSMQSGGGEAPGGAPTSE